MLSFNSTAYHSKLRVVILGRETRSGVQETNNLHVDTKNSGGTALSQLEILSLSNCNLNSDLTSSIGGLKDLVSLDLSFNNFTGEVPKELVADCTNYWTLVLSDNNFSGQIFSAYFNLSNVQHLKLNNSHLTRSSTDVNFELLEEIALLDISNNNLTGKIPRSFANLHSRLWILNMKNNYFEGDFPCGQNLWTSLNAVDLSDNFFSGPLPSCFGSHMLKALNLERNRFTGSISVRLLNSTYLTMLNLRNNRLSGSISAELVGVGIPNIRIIMLANNGSIPSCFNSITFGSMFPGEVPRHSNQYLVSLFDLVFSFTYVSDNNLHKEHSVDLYSFSSWINLQAEIDFTTKYLLFPYKGGIVEYMSGLDLSSNNLTRTIPWSIGDLSSIRALNLSHNHLTGSIPISVSNLSKIERKIPDVPQLSTFDERSYEGNPFLCGKPLPKSCTSCVDENDDEPGQLGTSSKSEGKWYEVDRISFFASLAATYIMVLLGSVIILYINPYW
ncbi:hypothetical protein COLO4_11885 [Corchorus olitorius]|uniref:Uncharacterized protein n=1 Tax=Corchorus olitorius TaxID=93759 RepID=A0A1R3K2V2_9ROSI|nr:hypothetical protein COLO4_11885 [Corchorus olitorius]